MTDSIKVIGESMEPLPLTAVAWTPMPEVYHGNDI